ncbi:MAG: hypothetical protein WAM28_05335 [Chlamydiales bacterium]
MGKIFLTDSPCHFPSDQQSDCSKIEGSYLGRKVADNTHQRTICSIRDLLPKIFTYLLDSDISHVRRGSRQLENASKSNALWREKLKQRRVDPSDKSLPKEPEEAYKLVAEHDRFIFELIYRTVLEIGNLRTKVELLCKLAGNRITMEPQLSAKALKKAQAISLSNKYSLNSDKVESLCKVIEIQRVINREEALSLLKEAFKAANRIENPLYIKSPSFIKYKALFSLFEMQAKIDLEVLTKMAKERQYSEFKDQVSSALVKEFLKTDTEKALNIYSTIKNPLSRALTSCSIVEGLMKKDPQKAMSIFNEELLNVNIVNKVIPPSMLAKLVLSMENDREALLILRGLVEMAKGIQHADNRDGQLAKIAIIEAKFDGEEATKTTRMIQNREKKDEVRSAIAEEQFKRGELEAGLKTLNEIEDLYYIALSQLSYANALAKNGSEEAFGAYKAADVSGKRIVSPYQQALFYTDFARSLREKDPKQADLVSKTVFEIVNDGELDTEPKIEILFGIFGFPAFISRTG